VSRTERLRIAVGERSVAALLVRPRAPRALYALAHGAGAGMTHRFLEAFAGALADRGVATLRYQFPYAEAGRRRPDPRPLLLATVRAAVAVAAARAGGLTLLAGGKSMGGRMTSLAAAEAPLAGVAGLVFAGFPLHPARRPGIERAEHLDRVALPMLFLAGTRDALAELPLLRPVCARLAGRAELHVVDGADHGFAVLRRSGRTGEAVTAELADAVRAFADRVARA
jgi:predicted alpha/beta-hydrolase family hydrolase